MTPPVVPQQPAGEIELIQARPGRSKHRLDSWDSNQLESTVLSPIPRQTSSEIEVSRREHPRATKRPRLGSKVLLEDVREEVDYDDFSSITTNESGIGSVTDAERKQCFICMEEFCVDQPGRSLPCSNVICQQTEVHAKCIYEWKQTSTIVSSPSDSNASAFDRQAMSQKCPLCRGKLMDFEFTPSDIINSASFHNLAARKKFFLSPLPREEGFLRCFIKLNKVQKPATKNFPAFEESVYELYLQSPTTLKYPLGPIPDCFSPAPGDKLLAVVHRTRFPQKADSNLNQRRIEAAASISELSIHLTDSEYKKSDSLSQDETLLGVVKSSFCGFKHEILVPSKVNKYDEVGCVLFVRNKNTGRNCKSPAGPRRVQVCLKKPHQQLACCDNNTDSIAEAPITPMETVRKPLGRLSQALLYKSLKSSLGTKQSANEGLYFGKNKEPYWLESIQAYSLDFRGRVTLPSNKNLQLMLEDEECELENVVPELMTDKFDREAGTDGISLQFGKVGEREDCEVYSMDFRYPLTPLQAFGICLGASDRNLAW